MSDSPRFRDAWTHHFLAGAGVGSIILALILLFFFEPPARNQQTIDIIIGALITIGLGSVYGYYFGSSQGSQRKTEVMATVATPPPGGTRVDVAPPAEVAVTTHTEGPAE